MKKRMVRSQFERSIYGPKFVYKCTKEDNGKDNDESFSQEERISNWRDQHYKNIKKVHLFHDVWELERENRRIEEQEKKESEREKEKTHEDKRLEEQLALNRIKHQLQEEQHDHNLTQQVLMIMRKSGFRNPTYQNSQSSSSHFSKQSILNNPQIETSQTVILINKHHQNHNDDKKKNQGFTVDLKYFRNASCFKGYQIGIQGAVELSEQFNMHVCPKLRKLELQWNYLHYQGFQVLMQSLIWNKKMYSKSIRHIDVASNHIPSKGMEILKQAFQQGAFPYLEYMNLSKNPIMNDGVQLLLHCILQGYMKHVRILNLSSCQIRHAGIHSMCCSIRTHQLKMKFLPSLDNLILTNNRPKKDTLNHFQPLPTFLKI